MIEDGMPFMQKYTFGRLLYRFRKERQLKVRQICEGLCTEEIYGSFEKEKNIPDTLLFERLLERMGVSPEEVSLMVMEEEYHAWKEQVCEVMENGKWDELEELLHSNIGTKLYCNEKIEKQFIFYVNGVHNGIKKDYVKAVRQLEYAAKMTMPNMYATLEKDVLLSTLELHILMLYLYYSIMGNVLDIEEGKVLFSIMEQYIYNGKSDINERAKCYPKLICMGLHLFSNSFKEREQIQLCKKAIDMLRENNNFHDITELLRLYILLLEKRESRELGFYKKQYEVFCDLLQSEGFDIGFQPECLNRSKPKVYILNEYLLAKRTEKGMTQEMLSEGICTPETYSRIETGTRAPRPKNVHALTEKLEIGWCYYRGELDTCDLKAFELRRMQRNADIEGRRYDSLDLLDDLEECLDMDSVVNYQYVTLCRSIAKYRLGKLSAEETCSILEGLLHLTQSLDADTSRLVYYSQTELEIVGHWAQVLREHGKYKEGILLCETVIKQMQHSKVGFEQQWNGFGFVFRVLSCLYFASDEYELSIELAEYVKHVEIKRREGSSIPVTLDTIADDLEHMGKRYSEEYKKLYRHTYYIADFFGIEKIIDFAKKYYEEHFDEEIEWYESYCLPVSFL